MSTFTYLDSLKAEKYLSQRFFKKLSENMHFEVFKFIDNVELLKIRSVNRGGYQLISNKIQRRKLGNHFPEFNPELPSEDSEVFKARKIEFMFEQTGSNCLSLVEGDPKYIIMIDRQQLEEFFMLVKLATDLDNLYIKDLRNKENLPLDTSIPKLFDYFTSVPHLQSLTIINAAMNGKCLEVLGVNLKYTPDLIDINLSDNPCTDEGVKGLVKGFQYIPKLQQMDLSQRWWEKTVGEPGLTALANNLKYIPKLKTLTLSSWDIAQHGAQSLGDHFKDIPLLVKLDLSINKLENEGTAVLAKYFKDIPKLTELDLSRNNIGPAGSKGFAQACTPEELPLLNILNLGFNELGDEGIVTLSEEFGNLPKLQELDLQFNRITDEGGLAMATNSHKITKLHKIDMLYNFYSEEGVPKVEEQFKAHLNISSYKMERVQQN